MTDTTDSAATTFDPTESVRTLKSDLYKEQTMTLREHQDTDKHYIGDALPVPSNSHIKPSGIGSSAGSSPFPSRADHVHEDRTTYGIFTSSGIAVPPGSTYINTLTHSGWGKNMLASGQVIAFPYGGIWMVQVNFFISRQGGGSFINEMNIVYTYSNGGYSRTILRQSNFDLPNQVIVSTVDIVPNNSAPSINDNVQFAVQHNDAATWDVSIQTLCVVRLGSAFTN